MKQAVSMTTHHHLGSSVIYHRNDVALSSQKIAGCQRLPDLAFLLSVLICRQAPNRIRNVAWEENVK
jgi:hypothetical protein